MMNADDLDKVLDGIRGPIGDMFGIFEAKFRAMAADAERAADEAKKLRETWNATIEKAAAHVKLALEQKRKEIENG
jgi:hypothetical protein